MSIYIPYTYLVGWSNLGEYYYGVRYKQGCHPNDFWKDYFTSSPKVAEYRELHGEPDIIQIRKTFDNRESAIAWEHKVLRRMKVIKEDHWLNRAAFPVFDNRGKNHPMFGKTLSKETKQKMSEANKGENHPFYGKTHSEEAKRKISEARKGKTFSEETKHKISAANKGKTLSKETKQKMSEASKGKTLSEETKKKMSEASKGKTHSEETKKKMSESSKGKTHSEETKKKMSEAKHKKTQCPNCGYEGNAGNLAQHMKKWCKEIK